MAADVKMNQLATATDGAYIYAEAEDSSQVKIKKSDIINIIRNSLTITFSSWEQLDSYVDSMPNNCVISFSSDQFVLNNIGFYGNYQSGFIHKFNNTLTVLISVSHSYYMNLRIKSNGGLG